MESFVPRSALRDRVVSIERVLSEGHAAQVLPAAGAVLGLQVSGRIIGPEGPLSALGVTGIPDTTRRYRYDGPTETFLVRFRPEGAGCFGVPASQLRGNSRSLDELWDAPGRARAAQLLDAMMSTPDTTRRVALLEDFLVGLPFHRDRRLQSALQHCDSGMPVARVARAIGLSERQLERLFQERVGISPKRYASLRRFERTTRLIRQGGALSDIAFANGYADQAHFIREFRRFAGTTPSRFSRASDFVG